MGGGCASEGLRQYAKQFCDMLIPASKAGKRELSMCVGDHSCQSTGTADDMSCACLCMRVRAYVC